MVNCIDIKKLNYEELAGVVTLYPWFGGARREMCERLLKRGACSKSQLAEAAMYIGDPRVLYDLEKAGRVVNCSDSNIEELLRSFFAEPTEPAESAAASEPTEDGRAALPRVVLAGGDYFSREQYAGARKDDDNIFSSFAAKATGEGGSLSFEDVESDEFYTETIAKIYLEQGYLDEAVKIYSKLSLRYPEKSVYFATLIDEINKKK